MQIEVREHNGRPLIFIDGEPRNPAMYSALDLGRPSAEPVWRQAAERFTEHDMDIYLVGVPHRWEEKFEKNNFWNGETISSEPLWCSERQIDKGPGFVLEHDPDAYVMIRFSPRPPANWYQMHPDHCVVNDAGERMDYPSMASLFYAEQAADFCRTYIRYCESRPWAARCLGYINYHLCEGCFGPVTASWRFDHSPVMQEHWRQWLTEKYKDDRALREAWGDESIRLEGVEVPFDKLRGTVPEVAAFLYWQNASKNQPLRDWLLMTRDLHHRNMRLIFHASHEGAPDKLLLHDCFKVPMQGWNNHGFFNPDTSWPVFFPEHISSSGLMHVMSLVDEKGFDGLCTPYDYQVRGAGGVFVPEGAAESMTLRGKLFFVEQDIRTYCGGFGHYGTMRDMQEFKALMWRDLAAALTGGFMNYFCDHNADYHAEPEMHGIIERQVQVLHESRGWPHETVPGIAMILDDEAPLETNGGGHVFNETVMWERRTGIARCGVPYRVYVLDDLRQANFPEHRVCYFPNMYRVDDERLALLQEKVFRDGKVIVWGPGSGISDGCTIAAEHASRLTGFEFSFEAVNYQRRVQIERWDHPVTASLPADCIFGGPLSYGPVLYPTDGFRLGMAWSKQGKQDCGLAVKDFSDHTAVFTAAVPMPADLWRGIARHAGAHIWCETSDILLADRSVVALHSLKPGARTINLPNPCRVTDLISNELVSENTAKIDFELDGCDTRVYRMERA